MKFENTIDSKRQPQTGKGAEMKLYTPIAIVAVMLMALYATEEMNIELKDAGVIVEDALAPGQRSVSSEKRSSRRPERASGRRRGGIDLSGRVGLPRIMPNIPEFPTRVARPPKAPTKVARAPRLPSKVARAPRPPRKVARAPRLAKPVRVTFKKVD